MAAYDNHGARAPGLAPTEFAAYHSVGLASLGAAGAAAAGLTAAPKDEAREPLADGAGFRGHDTADSVDCPGTVPEGQDEFKRFATLQARLALAGWALSRCDAEGLPTFVAVRWNMPRELHDLAAVERFADLVGAPA